MARRGSLRDFSRSMLTAHPAPVLHVAAAAAPRPRHTCNRYTTDDDHALFTAAGHTPDGDGGVPLDVTQARVCAGHVLHVKPVCVCVCVHQAPKTTKQHPAPSHNARHNHTGGRRGAPAGAAVPEQKLQVPFGWPHLQGFQAAGARGAGRPWHSAGGRGAGAGGERHLQGGLCVVGSVCAAESKQRGDNRAPKPHTRTTHTHTHLNCR